ncbi:dTDP-4-dehydrorhamnose reductase [Pigmentibacter ruber]
MSLIITGSTGQVGTELVNFCTKNNIEFRSFGSDLDITNKELVRKEFAKIKSESVVANCAAYTAVDKAEEEHELAFVVNYHGIENLATICKELNIPIIHLSTDYIFSGEEIAPYSENCIPKPINTYGMSKLKGEEILQEIWSKHIILRTSWVFSQFGNNFVKTILKLALQRENLSVVDDQIGCPTPAFGLAETIVSIYKQILNGNERWGIYNYCGFPSTTWFHFADQVIKSSAEFMELKIKELRKIPSEEYITKAKRPKNSVLLHEKIEKEFNIPPPDWKKHLVEILYALSRESKV